MAYFTAVIARAGLTWKVRDVEVGDASTLDDLVDLLRGVAVGDEPVIAVVEHEDEWFAIVRVDGDELPRLFVSDLGAASVGHYGEMLSPAADVDDPDEFDADPAAEGDESDEDDEQPKSPAGDEIAIAVWAGETDLLEDLGVPGRTLRKLVEDNADDPGAVLVEVGETVGFADLLEALR